VQYFRKERADTYLGKVCFKCTWGNPTALVVNRIQGWECVAQLADGGDPTVKAQVSGDFPHRALI